MRGTLETVYVNQIMRNFTSVEEPLSSQLRADDAPPMLIGMRPKKFVTRYVNTYRSPKQNMKPQEYPPRDQLSYDCYLTGVICTPRMQCFNFAWSNKKRTHLTNYNLPEQQITVTNSADVRHVICWYSQVNGLLTGI